MNLFHFLSLVPRFHDFNSGDTSTLSLESSLDPQPTEDVCLQYYGIKLESSLCNLGFIPINNIVFSNGHICADPDLSHYFIVLLNLYSFR
jgi:hypothetical protein